MGCLSGKALQGKQLAVKRRFKLAVPPAHLARLRLQKDARIERGNQTSKTVSCGPVLRPHPALLRRARWRGDARRPGTKRGRRGPSERLGRTGSRWLLMKRRARAGRRAGLAAGTANWSPSRFNALLRAPSQTFSPCHGGRGRGNGRGAGQTKPQAAFCSV